MKFTYWDNSKEVHGKLLLEVFAKNIEDADEAFKANLGYDPAKKSTIGCTIDLD